MSRSVVRGLSLAGAGHTTVYLAEDFTATVNSLSGQATYDANRCGGTVIARTLSDPPSTVVLNLPATAERRLSPEDLERIAAHEGCHVLMYDRGELKPVADHRGRLPSFLGVAEGQIEEYRCELTVVRELGYPPSPHASPSSVPDRLADAEETVLRALMDNVSATDGGIEMWNRVHGAAMVPLLKSLAETAGGAAALDSDLSRADLGPAREQWDDILAPTWEQRLSLLRSLPPASQPFDQGSHADAVRELARLEHLMLADLGFAFADSNEGTIFTSTLSPAKTIERAQRLSQVASWLDDRT